MPRRNSFENVCGGMPLRLLGAVTAGLLPPPPGAPPAVAETRGYVIGWFATATHSTDFSDNCPQNLNGGKTEMLARDLMDIGYSKEEAYATIAKSKESLPSDLRAKTVNRAIVNGKHVSVYNYPEAVTRNLETVTGKY